MSVIVLDHLPLPPSENECYLTRNSGKPEWRVSKKGRRFPHVKTWRAPTKALEDFQKAMDAYRLERPGIVTKARTLLVSRIPFDQKPIRVDRYFAFHRDRLFALDGKLKALDASNRVKPFDDALSSIILGLDDRYFVEGIASKVFVDDPADECVVCALSLTSLARLDDLVADGGLGIPDIVRRLSASLPI